MDRYPILKDWVFESNEVLKNLSKEVIEETIIDLQEIEKFVNLYSEKKLVFSSKLNLKAKVFGKKDIPDNSEIITDNLIKLEKGLDINPYLYRKVLVATTESGLKYELEVDEDVKIDTSLLQKLL